MHLTVGDVIFWRAFPYPRDEIVKSRWFVYLGKTGHFSTPTFIYLCTTTTQRHHFEPGGLRSNHTFIRFNIRQFPFFESDCIMDLDEELHDIREDMLIANQSQITLRGRLDENTLRNIYNQLRRSDVLSPVMLRDIFDSFNRDNITGLKKPK